MCGLKPWDADPENPGCLSYGEVNEYLRALSEHTEQIEAAEAKARMGGGR